MLLLLIPDPAHAKLWERPQPPLKNPIPPCFWYSSLTLRTLNYASGRNPGVKFKSPNPTVRLVWAPLRLEMIP